MERPKRQREDNQNEDMISEERHKRQHKDNQNEDMISVLTDCLLLHILSFLNTKEAVQTCILSKRWINLWKTLPVFSLNQFDFDCNLIFREFVSQILSRRDDSAAISALHMYDCHSLGVNLFQKTIKYAVSHNVKHLQLHVPTIEHLPSCFFSCLTLTSLNLSAVYGEMFHLSKPQIFPNSLKLPALTTLSVEFFAFRRSDDGCVEPFSAFNMLNTLIVRSCVVLDGQNLRISSTKLVNLTIQMYRSGPTNRCLMLSFGVELYYAPSLHTFAFIGSGCSHKLSGSKSVLTSIKHVDIDFFCFATKNPAILLDWLIELANIESLTITPSTLKVLSRVPDLLEVKLPFLCNLKSLKIKIHLYSGCFSSIPDGMLNCLLQNSPSAKVGIINYKVERCIPSLMDGLVPAQRKILYGSFKKDLVQELKVNQFIGYVSELCAYHHDEGGLAQTLIRMAQNFVGGNNINLLMPIGQYGSRNSAGKDRARPRYLSTKLSPLTRCLFPDVNDSLLEYVKEDGKTVEPVWFLPIIPMVLVNGSRGVGVGRKSHIPKYNHKDIIKNIRLLNKSLPIEEMTPYYKNFNGTVEKFESKDKDGAQP